MFRHLLVLLAILTLAAPALPTVHVVDQGGGGNYTTIGGAVSAASTGDTVLINAGVYQGTGNTNVDLGGKNLVIRSESGAANTTIDCERIGPNTRAFYLHSGEDTTCIIENLTILRGYAISGAGIWCDGASPKIVSCTFDSCGVAYGTVRLDNSEARVIDCEFNHCSVFVAGAAFYIGNSSPVIRNTTINSCTSGFHGGGMIIMDGGSSSLTDVTLTGCSAGGDGGGIYCQDAPPTLNRVHFIENQADSTRGGALYISCDSSLNGCTFTGNYAGQEGGGIYCWGSFLDADDCEFTGNAASAGGGIYGEDAMLDVDGGSFYGNLAGMGGGACAQGGVPAFTNAVFDADTAAIYGGALAFLDATGLVDYCTFTGNEAWDGAAVYCDGPADPTFDHCTMSGNTADVSGATLLCEASDPTVTNTIIAYTIDGAGMRCDLGASPSTTHSCFHANDAGDGLCGSYADNIFVDPLFCSPPTADVELHDDSQCLPANNSWSEQIGARGAGGCGPSTGVAEHESALRMFPPSPNPSSESTSVRWNAPSGARAALSIFDPSGRLVRETRASAGIDGVGLFLWDGRDSAGHEVASGTYLVRVECAGEVARGTVVIVR